MSSITYYQTKLCSKYPKRRRDSVEYDPRSGCVAEFSDKKIDDTVKVMTVEGK